MTTRRNASTAFCRWSLVVLLPSICCWIACGTARAQTSFEHLYDSTESVQTPPTNPWEEYYSSNLAPSQTPAPQSVPIVPVGLSNGEYGDYYDVDGVPCEDAGGYGAGGSYGAGDSGLDRGGYGDDALITAQRYDDHWVNISGRYVNFNRSDSAGSLPLTSDGVTGPILLSTGDVNLETNSSAGQVSLFLDLWHGFDLELGWLGGLQWDGAARVTSPTNSLYSVFSDFGINPAQGFEETDQAADHRIRYLSELDNYEVNAWFRWSHTTKPWTGAWILGARYLQLRESLIHSTRAVEHIDPITADPRGPGVMDYRSLADNDLVGFNFGLEAMRTVAPGWLLGGNFQAGIYGNSAKSSTRITATTITDEILAKQRRGQTAFVAEANFDTLYRLFSEFYIRAGYQMLFVEGVSFAPDNFTTDSPFVEPRPTILNTNGHLFLSGFHVGAEYQW